MSKSIGDGLDALALAIFLLGLLWFVFNVGKGGIKLINSSDGYSPAQARCVSISGVYGSGKCYVDGNEMFSGSKDGN